MKRITKLALVILGVAGFAGLGAVGMQAVEEADAAHILKLDVACDCRTGSQAFFGGNRGDVFIVNGKIFPAGTLPSGQRPMIPPNLSTGSRRSASGCAAAS